MQEEIEYIIYLTTCGKYNLLTILSVIKISLECVYLKILVM